MTFTRSSYHPSMCTVSAGACTCTPPRLRPPWSLAHAYRDRRLQSLASLHGSNTPRGMVVQLTNLCPHSHHTTYNPLYSKCGVKKIQVFCDLRISKSKQRIACEKHFKTFLCHLGRSVLFWSNQWSVTTSTEVHGTFTPADTRDRLEYNCLYSCLYSCVITAHRTGQDAHMNGNLALVV